MVRVLTVSEKFFKILMVGGSTLSKKVVNFFDWQKNLKIFLGPREYPNHKIFENFLGHREYPNHKKNFEKFSWARGNPNYKMQKARKNACRRVRYQLE